MPRGLNPDPLWSSGGWPARKFQLQSGRSTLLHGTCCRVLFQAYPAVLLPVATWSAAVGPVAYGPLVAVELQKPGRRQTRRKVRDTVFMYSNSRPCPQSPPSTHLSPPPPPGRGRACSRCDHASPGRCGGQPNWSTGRAGPSSLPLRHWAGTGRRARAESGWPARPNASDRGD